MYLIYINGVPENEEFDNFEKVKNYLLKKYKSEDAWKKNIITRIYFREIFKEKDLTFINIIKVNNNTGKLEDHSSKSSKARWKITLKYKDIFNLSVKIFDKQQMKTVYILWDEIRKFTKLDLDKEIKNLNFQVINNCGKQTQHSRLVEFFSDVNNCGIIWKYSELNSEMEKKKIKLEGRGIEGERPREFRYMMGYEFITSEKDRNIPEACCKVISPFPTKIRNERRSADLDLEKKDWSETVEILKKNILQLRCIFCGRFENETNRIGQKTKFQKGHLTSHLSGGDVSKKNIIEICQYCNTFLSNYFDIELEGFKLSVNPFKAVEKSSRKIKIDILKQLITKNFESNEIKKILDDILKKI
jgi:hypothetical protein